MAAYKQVNNYLNNHYGGMDPQELILKLFNGAINRLQQTVEGIKEKDIKKRGENLSKAIAIISELNASVDPTMNDESTQFLRGLYKAILIELPKVSLHNDIRVVERSQSYIEKLKEIWENDVMGKAEYKTEKIIPAPMSKQGFPPAASYKNNAPESFQAISV